MQKRLITIILGLCLFAACRKDRVATSGDAYLFPSETHLQWDTVFSGVGSVTQKVRLFNTNNGTLILNEVQLMGGDSSPFKLNVSGTPGTDIRDIAIAGGDSLYLFVSLTAPANAATQPFVLEDSIRISYNGNTQWIYLEAWGQNAHFLRSAVIRQNTTWKNDLPYVLLDSLTVLPGATLTLKKGVQLYCHAGAALNIEGSLQAMGSSDSNRVVFTSDRLDAPYKAVPGAWQGIRLGKNSRGNLLQYVTIQNAVTGIAAAPGSSVTAENTLVNNCAREGIRGENSSIEALNCLISNSSYNLYVANGGNYVFTNCTLAAYSTEFLSHQSPVVTLWDGDDNGGATHPLTATFTNCILWGEEGWVSNELAVNTRHSSSVITLQNTLYRGQTEIPMLQSQNSFRNTDPLFQTVDIENNRFDFHLSPLSPAIDAGKEGTTPIDLAGAQRQGLPDLGCYEWRN